MTREIAEHFYRWLTNHVAEDEQHIVEQQIHALLREYPGMIAENKSWSEMRQLATQLEWRDPV